jgi:hypothetical protein
MKALLRLSEGSVKGSIKALFRLSSGSLKVPGRQSASSRMSKRLVAATHTTPFFKNKKNKKKACVTEGEPLRHYFITYEPLNASYRKNVQAVGRGDAQHVFFFLQLKEPLRHYLRGPVVISKCQSG